MRVFVSPRPHRAHRRCARPTGARAPTGRGVSVLRRGSKTGNPVRLWPCDRARLGAAEAFPGLLSLASHHPLLLSATTRANKQRPFAPCASKPASPPCGATGTRPFRREPSNSTGGTLTHERNHLHGLLRRSLTLPPSVAQPSSAASSWGVRALWTGAWLRDAAKTRRRRRLRYGGSVKMRPSRQRIVSLR